MSRVYKIIFFILIISVANAQDKLIVYKQIVDQKIRKDIKLNEGDSIQLADLYIAGKDCLKGTFIKFKTNQEKKIPFITSTFFYTLYNADINYSFRFNVKINSNKSILPDSEYLSGIPKCILRGEKCNYISKDSALQIAKRDSILFSDNLKVVLLQERYQDKYTWYVTAKPKKEFKGNSTTFPDSLIQRRIIDPYSGKIISRTLWWSSMEHTSTESKILNDICNCLDETDTLTQENILPCVQNKMGKYTIWIEQQLKSKKIEPTYENAVKFGTTFIEESLVKLVHTCKKYYQFIDNSQFTFLHSVNQDSIKNLIILMNNVSEDRRDKDFYIYKGDLYLQIQYFDSALKDYDMALKIEPNTEQALYHKAVALELQLKYDEAIILFNTLAINTKNNLYNLLVSVVTMKKTGN